MSEENKIFQLRYVGDRFDGARLPLDVLLDLPAFRDLLVSYAKDKWRAFNIERQRLPKGFDKSISFDLVAIEEGSAMPKLDWSRQVAQATLPGFSDQLEEVVDESYVELVGLIDRAGHQQFPPALSSEHIRALNKLGSGLRENERIEFVGSRGADGNVVYLDLYRRKALITHVRETYQIRYEGIGSLIGLHVADGWISVDAPEYGRLQIPVDPDRVADEFDGNTSFSVQFALQIELDNRDNFRSIIDVFDVELIDSELSDKIEVCRKRLADLRELQDGWLDGDGYAPKSPSLESADKFLSKRPSLAGQYKIYPTSLGGVLFEFQVHGWDYSVEFGPAGTVEMYGVEIDGIAEMEPLMFEDAGDTFVTEFDSRMAR
jgi:hypothetical protein